jgi:hypothetical protein
VRQQKTERRRRGKVEDRHLERHSDRTRIAAIAATHGRSPPPGTRRRTSSGSAKSRRRTGGGWWVVIGGRAHSRARHPPTAGHHPTTMRECNETSRNAGIRLAASSSPPASAR